MKKIKNFEDHSLKNDYKVSFTKQTMRLDIDWVAAKDFDVHYEHSGYSSLFTNYGSKLVKKDKLKIYKKEEIKEILDYAKIYGGSTDLLAFTVKKGTKLKVDVKEQGFMVKANTLDITIMDGPYSNNVFTTSLLFFRTYLIGKPKDEDLVISKYKIFLNGDPLKSKYYTNMGRVKLALLSAFKLIETEDDDEDSDVPYYVSSYDTLGREDCKNIQIMRYDNNSKVGVLVDFDMLKYYDDYLENKKLKKDAKKYNL